MSNLSTIEEREQHAAASDQVVEDLKEAVANNKTYHDGLSEAQAMIGERDLRILELKQEIKELNRKPYRLSRLFCR